MGHPSTVPGIDTTVGRLAVRAVLGDLATGGGSTAHLAGLPWPAALAIPLWVSGPGGAVTALRHHIDTAVSAGAR